MNEASAKRCSDGGMSNETTPSCESQDQSSTNLLFLTLVIGITLLTERTIMPVTNILAEITDWTLVMTC